MIGKQQSLIDLTYLLSLGTGNDVLSNLDASEHSFNVSEEVILVFSMLHNLLALFLSKRPWQVLLVLS